MNDSNQSDRPPRSVSALKQEYLDKLTAQLDEWGSDIEKVKAKAEHASADAKIEYHRLLQDWEAKKNAAQLKLKELKDDSTGRLEELKHGIENAWSELKTAIDKARAKHP